MITVGRDQLNVRSEITIGGESYAYYDIQKAAAQIGSVDRLPFSLKILLENLLRREDGRTVTVDDIKAVIAWLDTRKSDHEIAYQPARVLMQDFTGVPAVADLGAMRDAMVAKGGKASKINPLSAVDLVIDHSVTVDEFGTPTAFRQNVDREFERNYERYAFLKWGQKAFENFRVVPPGTGICHQVNLEYLAQTVWVDQDQNGQQIAYPDTLVGTDSHTTMVNGLGVLGWGVGGIEAEAAMLGQPISMIIPEVIGFKLTGELKEGATATDLVLTVTEMLRKKGVVGKFVEFYGEGVSKLSLADRATIGNMAPEYGATCGIFPIDQETLNYLKFTGRDDKRIALVEHYAKAQGYWYDANSVDPVFSDMLTLNMNEVESSLAGPKRPQDRILVSKAAESFIKDLGAVYHETQEDKSADVKGTNYQLENGHVVIAAITSCTNTSNPAVMIAAGLVARKAREKGLSVKPWVKTSLAPGSQVVTDYLEAAKLQDDLDAMGFNLVGYGCTTCIGNSGPLSDQIVEAIDKGALTVCSVLSGNRNFEGRINPHAKANYLASPPLVVAYAIAGSMKVDLFKDPIGQNDKGENVYLKDIWPKNHEIKEILSRSLTPDMFKKRYANVFEGPEQWQAVPVTGGDTYAWDAKSTYVKMPPLFDDSSKGAIVADIKDAYALAVFGDSVTTDHISPAGAIKTQSPAGQYLVDHGVEPRDFNSYGSRRGNHEVMMRGTFANIRIKNEMLGGVEGGYTKLIPEDKELSIYDAAMSYQKLGAPLLIFAGKEYGTGSSRDWAAKGTKLLGVKAVIAESFERIHRSNLVGMGVLPFQFTKGESRKSLNITGFERYDLIGLNGGVKPKMSVKLVIRYPDGTQKEADLLCRLDTLDEVDYFNAGGILTYVLNKLSH